MSLLLAAIAFVSTLGGGIVALRYQDRLHLILGFTAGVVLGVVSFDIFPEIVELTHSTGMAPVDPMIALVAGFLLFHIVEKVLLVHHAEEDAYGPHTHPSVGVASALALVGHSFLDGVGIGLAFQVSTLAGVAVGLAVISHDFADGLNTVSLLLMHKNPGRRAVPYLVLDALAPVLGALSTLFFTLSDRELLLYLGFFAGFLLYIGAADVLPQAHSTGPSLKTIGMTVAGVVFTFIVTRFV